MKSPSRYVPVAAAALLAAATFLGGATADDVGPAEAEAAKVSVEEARGRARLLQSVYETTLHEIHRRYFDRDEKDVIPARALEAVFESVGEETGVSARWIAVNTPAMNVDHTPRDGFEVEAAKALGEGRVEFERVEDGVYRRAGAVRLFASCLKCHESGLTKQIVRERVAALVVSLPVEPQ